MLQGQKEHLSGQLPADRLNAEFSENEVVGVLEGNNERGYRLIAPIDSYAAAVEVARLLGNETRIISIEHYDDFRNNLKAQEEQAAEADAAAGLPARELDPAPELQDMNTDTPPPPPLTDAEVYAENQARLKAAAASAGDPTATTSEDTNGTDHESLAGTASEPASGNGSGIGAGSDAAPDDRPTSGTADGN